jgi:hypothetical protein
MESPIILSFLLADKVFREMETGKVHIAGTFNQLSAFSYPMVHPQFFSYIAVTALKAGKHQLGMELSYFESGEKLLKVDQEIKSGGPLEVIEMNMCFNQIMFKNHGNVELVLKLNNEIMQTRKLILKKIEKKPI